ncbi:3-dehydroquinate synthase [Thermanaeromonas toyohensis ToBE]|uniref:3-dehydroquinate synthase n=1 Tax=Thermanaeromonas toyohensis ToBE TaxID=698762 RepID=A0A1W1VZ37_9FIRM|nr:3-dehydroquinate synthase [Thermanaeromonas toyohensis]SMB98625.1 3-dehydroquinate synthase [Thermanaeromonas toyohensis ToBE]
MVGKLQVDLGDRSYNIYCGQGLLKKLGVLLQPLDLAKRCLIVTDEIIAPLYLSQVIQSLEAAGFLPLVKQVPPGEEAKSLSVAAELYDMALEAGWERRCPVLALGGGTIGDLAGFVAATLLRGVPLIQLPTTLLAQVDSSVGGKVAVNHPRGKNLIGAFYQPCLVVADLSTLKSLPKRELCSGLAEVIKYGMIYDALFFTYLEQHLEEALAGEEEILERIVLRSCEIKAQIVAQDERERDLRAILNFGHTVGHALEAVTKFHVYRHGEAVAIGMMVATRIALSRGLISPEIIERLEKLLRRASLPVEMPNVERYTFLEALIRDKKVREGRVRMVLPVSLGQVEIMEVDTQEIMEAAGL